MEEISKSKSCKKPMEKYRQKVKEKKSEGESSEKTKSTATRAYIQQHTKRRVDFISHPSPLKGVPELLTITFPSPSKRHPVR